mgnify:CR=1 FL=1
MPFRFTNPHKIRIILSIAVILFGLVTIGLVFTPYGNPPQCGEGEAAVQNLKPPDCIIGANIGAGIMLLFGMLVVWLGVLGLLASLAYTARQSHQQTRQRWLLAVTAILFIAPFILWHIFITIPSNEAVERIEQEEAAFQEKYRSNFIEYSTPPNWNGATKESGTVAYSENSSLALYLNQCETGRSYVQYVNGRTYFVFSGIKDTKCVFYIHTQPAVAGTWDNLLRTKCVWDIDSGNDNTPIFSAGPNGVEFGDFLSRNCTTI